MYENLKNREEVVNFRLEYKKNIFDSYDIKIARWLAATFFERYGASKAFPCFDEPHLKANFTLTIVHDKKFSAISNAPVKKKFGFNKNSVTTQFETTPLMSTYLVAFVVSDFNHVTNKAGNVTLYLRPNVYEMGQKLLEISEKALLHLEEYTGIKYPLKILNQAVIPNNHQAMENWGMITYG